MAESSRLDDLRRRVEKDPASIAFAQLAEELRRAGRCEEAIEVCHAGLQRHPGYLSARVTFGRALLELNRLDEAQHELDVVLKSAPENLAAIRGLAEIFERRGDLADALKQYRAALTLARHDPELEETVATLTRELAKQQVPQPSAPLSFEQTAQMLSQGAAAGGNAAAEPGPSSVAPQDGTMAGSDPARDRAERTISALEEFLAAINVPRPDRDA